ncbi:GNAT family N-acetyltransferase [Roseimicrobium sp. ORNL1]|nr:GNAT family N-acetyltransferase [Roseimicrobium sp. ORNL1]
MWQSPQLEFREIDPEQEANATAGFLSRNTWPFHARTRLTLDEARKVRLGPPGEVRTFWIHENDSPAGIVRAFDLEDADVGSVAFDLRIADACRGRGIGRAAIGWLAEWLFAEYPLLHRIEASTRVDNHAMRRALECNGFVLEGQLRQTWRSEDGKRHDTALYGRLRSDV